MTMIHPRKITTYVQLNNIYVFIYNSNYIIKIRCKVCLHRFSEKLVFLLFGEGGGP